ncbi:conserved hypothetical protein [Bradyrhizobium sp. ORS 285]|nr:conserved hypothetical protein [Bradyrhizobium sp. ORS 285]
MVGGTLDCFAALAMTRGDITIHIVKQHAEKPISNPSTNLLATHPAPESCPTVHPQLTEGAGKAGSLPPPWPPCEQKARGRNHRFG